jgi:hypothetical protein
MKVIKNNRKYNKPKQPVQISCNHCSSELEVLPSDIKDTIQDRDGNAHIFKCAVCFYDIYVDVSVTNW